MQFGMRLTGTLMNCFFGNFLFYLLREWKKIYFAYFEVHYCKRFELRCFVTIVLFEV